MDAGSGRTLSPASGAEGAKRAIIIGGGIAGPTTAMALQRVGFQPVIYEAHRPVADDVGSYFTITTNGLYALRALGLDHIAVEMGFPARQIVMLNDRGDRLAAVPLGRALPDGTLSQTIKRTRLSRALLAEAERRGIPVEVGKGLVEATTTADQVRARFDDGSEATGDLLVDGVHSITRRLIDPRAPAPRYVGLVNFGGYTDGVAAPGDPESWHMIFGRRAFFGYQVDPRGGVVWFANVPRPPVGAAERAATSLARWQTHLADLFADDRGPARELVRCGTLELAADNTHDLPRVPHWHAGRVVLVGDAAHAPSPSSGQGASMAIEDAVVLARCLREAPTITEAFGAFERGRRRRVERIVAQGARSGSTKTSAGAARLLRDITLKIMARFFITERALAWMYDYRADLGQPLTAVS